MDRDQVLAWVAAYERAWRAEDPGAVAKLFTPDAKYRPSPYEESRVGHAAIADLWLADAGEVFTVRPWVVAVEGHDAVVRLDVTYGDPARQEYRDVWLLRFADDGRVEDFEEWAYWPGRPYTAEGEG